MWVMFNRNHRFVHQTAPPCKYMQNIFRMLDLGLGFRVGNLGRPKSEGSLGTSSPNS